MKWGYAVDIGKKRSRAFIKVVLFTSILMIIIGIFKVNLELAEVVKPSSDFHVTLDKDPLLITLTIGEFKIKFNGERFENFFKGIEAIVEGVF